MKRLLLVCVLLLAVPAAFAQRNSDVLLTDGGTLYTVATEWSEDHPELNAASRTYVVLTVRDADAEPKRMIVPATLSAGTNSNPALAYDETSGTVFVFWQYTPNAMASELKFIALSRERTWSEPSSFGNATYHLRRNLRIAVTSKAGEENEEGFTTWVPEINVHATWWEENGAGERARYAMLTVHGGEVTPQVHDLSEFTTVSRRLAEEERGNQKELLRHPAIFESADGRSVDVVFGDLDANSFHRVTIMPLGRVRIPVGVQDKIFEPPMEFAAMSVRRIDAISPSPDRLVFYYDVENGMKYIVYRDGAWSSVRTVALDQAITRDTAIGAMRRLVGAQ